MRRVLFCLCITSALLSGFQPNTSPSPACVQAGQEDTLVWQTANRFTALFNSGDTAAMNQFLPADFVLQWLHDNFIGKKSILNAMVDSAVHATLKHHLKRDAQTTVGYSDDHNAACIDATFEFLDQTLMDTIRSKKGYGLCIMHFKKMDGLWRIQTVHLDLHCAICDL